ncbi:hypothetical protein HMPREF1580_01386 [Gardnerella vaginalis JCP8070]|nr:hypothetical protein HMPREF1580_01386 [Gardnerella vaginalis JCP8070]
MRTDCGKFALLKVVIHSPFIYVSKYFIAYFLLRIILYLIVFIILDSKF